METKTRTREAVPGLSQVSVCAGAAAQFYLCLRPAAALPGTKVEFRCDK